MKTGGRVILTLAVILGLGPGFWAIATAYVKNAGAVAKGEVTGKREAIAMPGEDSWTHIFEVTYRYKPFDSPYPQTAGHRVDPSLFHRLQVGSPVQVRYSPSPFLRPMEGVGSFLADSSLVSRLGYDRPDVGDLAEVAGVVLALLLLFLAYRRKSQPLGVLAAFIGGAWFPPGLLALSGLVLFPTLFWASRRNPGKGYLWALLATVVLTAAILYWRIPQPTARPSGPLGDGTAIVRQERRVDELWYSPRTGGQGIRQPFQMLDLEFTPEGTSESIHVLDRIDLDSVPGLRQGSRVPIVYSSGDAASARVAGGTRNYARQAWMYLLWLTYGFGAVLAFVVVPAAHAAGKLFRSPALRGFADPGAAIGQWPRLPADDPRRKAFDRAVRAIQRPKVHR